MKIRKSIYKEIKKRFPDAETDSHESDFYIKYSDEIWQFLKENYDYFCNCEKFRSQIDNALWIDIPFSFDPFWNKKLNIK